MTMQSKSSSAKPKVPDNPAMDNTALTVPDPEKNPTVGEKAPETEPWDAENDPNHPSHRGILAVHKKHKGFQSRWVNENQIDRRKMQGYELAKPEDYDVEGVDGRVTRNEMVLMEISHEDYAKNRAGVNAKTEDLAKSAKSNYRRDVADASSRTRGGIKGTDDADTDEQ